MILFIILRQPITISVTVFSNLTKLTNYLSLLALHLSRTPRLMTSTSPPSCLLLDNRLYIYISSFFFVRFFPEFSFRSWVYQLSFVRNSENSSCLSTFVYSVCLSICHSVCLSVFYPIYCSNIQMYRVN